jgi:anaerobic ribonucleoside-triphosphate reductase activating protein
MAVETWDFDGGQLMETDDIFDMITHTSDIEGVTFLGGEPFEQAKAVSILAGMIQSLGLSVTVFTGYTYDELIIKNDLDINNLISATDLLIDGRFMEEKFDLSRPWVGSSNQRYHFLTKRYCETDISNIKNKIEIRISPNGKILINGMGDFKDIKKII